MARLMPRNNDEVRDADFAGSPSGGAIVPLALAIIVALAVALLFGIPAVLR